MTEPTSGSTIIMMPFMPPKSSAASIKFKPSSIIIHHQIPRHEH